MLKEFKDFISKGNIIEVAIAFIFGVAFAAVVKAFINYIIMDIIAAIVGKPSFNAITIHWGAKLGIVGDPISGGASYQHMIHIGAFVTEAVNFLLIALALFVMAKAYTKMQRNKPEEEKEPSEAELLTEIRDLLASQDGGRRRPLTAPSTPSQS